MKENGSDIGFIIMSMISFGTLFTCVMVANLPGGGVDFRPLICGILGLIGIFAGVRAEGTEWTIKNRSQRSRRCDRFFG